MPGILFSPAKSFSRSPKGISLFFEGVSQSEKGTCEPSRGEVGRGENGGSGGCQNSQEARRRKMFEIVAVFETLLYFPSCHYCFSHSKQELYDLQNNREMGVRVLFCEYFRPFFVFFVIFPPWAKRLNRIGALSTFFHPVRRRGKKDFIALTGFCQDLGECTK